MRWVWWIQGQSHGEEVDQQKEAVRPSSVERMIEDLRVENALLRKLVADLALATAKLKERLEGEERPRAGPI